MADPREEARPSTRCAGELALRFDELDKAERWFARGVPFGERYGLALEVGCGLQGLAEMAQRRGDHAAGITHLDEADEIFSRHGVRLRGHSHMR